MKLLENLPIAARIALLSFVPLAALTAVAGGLLVESHTRANRAQTVAEAAALAPIISDLVHDLQRERGQSSGFLGSQGRNFGDTIGAQRAATDARLAAFETAFSDPRNQLDVPSFRTTLGRVRDGLARLDDMRDQVDGLAIGERDMAAFYTAAVSELLALQRRVAEMIRDPEALRWMTGYLALVEAKDYAGRERSAGVVGFGQGFFGRNAFLAFVEMGARQATLLQEFRYFSTPEAVAFFDAALGGPVSADVETYRAVAREAGFTGSVRQVPEEAWFDAATRRIDALKRVEDQVIADIEVYEVALADEARFAFWRDLGLLGALLVAMTLASLAVFRSIVPPLKGMVTIMGRLASDETDLVVPGTERRDEVGAMARSVEVFRQNAIERRRLELATHAEREKELSRQRRLQDILSSFRGDLGAIVETLSGQTGDLKATAGKLADVARQAAVEAGSASAASTATSTNVATVASAAEELSASVQEIGAQTGRARDLVTSAAEMATDTDREVSELSTAAERIDTIVAMIRGIAEQTNLLALNAAIEAARAGDAGKGFAVVAAEVKTLASQTAKATEEIAAQIAGIQTSTRGAVASISRISQAVTEISELTTVIASAVEEQQATTLEISRSVNAAADGTRVVAGNVTSVSGAIEETSSEAEAVDRATVKLAGATETMIGDIERFLANVSNDHEDRRAALRTKMREAVVITHDGRRLTTMLHDASTEGALIGPVEGLAPGDAFRLSLSDGAVVPATVVRIAGDHIGVRFDKALATVDLLMAA